MSREVASDAILARLAALTGWPSAKPPAGVRDATRKAELAIAKATARVRLLEADLREAAEAESEWRDRAWEAVDQAAQRRAEGAEPEAERLDELSRVALRRRHDYQAAVDATLEASAEQAQLISELRDGVGALRERWGRQPARADPATELPPR